MNSCIVRAGRGDKDAAGRRVRSRTTQECLIKDACVDAGVMGVVSLRAVYVVLFTNRDEATIMIGQNALFV